MAATTPTVPPDLLAGLLDRAEIGVAILDGAGRFRYVNDRMATFNGRTPADHVGLTLVEVVPELTEALHEVMQRVVEGGEPVLSVSVQGRAEGDAPRHWEASYLPVVVDGGRGVGAVVMDVTEREDAVAETRRRLAQQVALADLAQRALEDDDLDGLLVAGTQMIATELGAQYAGLLELAPEGDHLVLRAGVGFPEGAVGTMRSPAGFTSQAGYTMRNRCTTICRDALTEDRFEFAPDLLELGVRSGISAPIPVGEDVCGVLGILDRRPDRFDEDDAALVRTAATLLGSALVRARQAEQLQELAEQRGRLVAQALDAGERERRHVADLLHDEVLQHLLFARLELGSAGGDPAVTARIDASLDEATALLRRVIGGLHPVMLAHAGLAAATESVAAEHTHRSGLVTDVDVQPDAEGIQDRLVVSLVRELLTNVVRHAQADRAMVSVRLEDGDLAVEVADDGIGLAPDAFETALEHGNVGLASARERVAALGGRIEVGTGLAGRGARVAVRLPAAA